MVKMSECMKTHPMAHAVTGLGLGLVLVALFPALATNALTLGLVLIVLSVLAHFMIK